MRILSPVILLLILTTTVPLAGQGPTSPTLPADTQSSGTLEVHTTTQTLTTIDGRPRAALPGNMALPTSVSLSTLILQTTETIPTTTSEVSNPESAITSDTATTTQSLTQDTGKPKEQMFLGVYKYLIAFIGIVIVIILTMTWSTGRKET